jgi:hypothetical protein
MPDNTSQDTTHDPSGGRSPQTDKPARKGGDDAPANKRGGAPDKLPVVEPSQPSVGPSVGSLTKYATEADAVRGLLGSLDRDALLRRLPPYLRTSTVLQNALPEIIRAVEAELLDATPTGAPTAPYRTVDAGGNLRDIVPGREPRRRGDRLPAEGVLTTAALTPAAPPSGAAPPVATSPDGRTRQHPGPYGAR